MEVVMRMMKIRSVLRNICFLLIAVFLTSVILLMFVPLNLVTDDQTLYEIDYSQRNIVLLTLAFTSIFMFPCILIYRKKKGGE